MLHYWSFFILFFYIILIVSVIYFLVKWVNKFFKLKQEHNDLMRELITKIESK